MCLLGMNHTIIQMEVKEMHDSDGENEENLPVLQSTDWAQGGA